MRMQSFILHYPLHYTLICSHFMSVFFPPYSSTILCLLLSVLLLVDLHTYLNSRSAIVPLLPFSCLTNGISKHLKRIIFGYIYFSIPLFSSLYYHSLTLPCLSLFPPLLSTLFGCQICELGPLSGMHAGHISRGGRTPTAALRLGYVRTCTTQVDIFNEL